MSKDNIIDFITAKNILLNKNMEEKRDLQNLDSFFKARFESAKLDPEKKIESLFFLLIAKLKNLSIETPETRKYFLLFLHEMELHISHITKENTSSE